MARHKRFSSIALAFVIGVLAVFLRVRHLDTTGIWEDQAFLLNTAMRWVNRGPMPLAANKSSLGIMHSPMIEYFYAVALWLWPDVLSVAVLTMVSGLAAVALTAWCTYKTFGKKAAYVGAALFAVNPWSVFYSQLIWNPTLVPVFSSLTLACLLMYFAVQQRSLYLIAGLVSLGLMIQLHPTTAVQLLTTGLVCVLFWRKVRLRPLLAGGALFVLLYLPFLLYQYAVGGRDVRALLEFTREPAALTPAALLVSLDLLGGKGLLSSVSYVRTFDALASTLLILSLAYAVCLAARSFVRRHRDLDAAKSLPALLIPLLWFAVPVTFFLRSSHYVQTHYLVGQLPSHFILIGIGIAGLGRGFEILASRVHQRTTRRRVRLIAWSLLLVPVFALVGWQGFFNWRFQDHRRQTQRGPAQIRHLRAVIHSSRRLLAAHASCDLVALASGHSVETSELAPLREFVSAERVLLADGRRAVPIPAPCAIYVDAQGASRASAWLPSVAEPLPDETVPVLGEPWRFYKLSSDGWTDEVGGSAAESYRATWANGLTLTEYRRGELRRGSTIPLTLTWTIESPTPEILYHFGSYLLTLDNQVVAQADGPGFDSIQWREGDSFVTWFDIPVPENLGSGRYWIAVGLYTWPDVERIALNGGENTAFLEEIEFGEP